MVRAAHRLHLGAARDHRVRRGPDDHARDQHQQQPLGVRPVALGARDPAHAEPQVVIAREEQHADQERLQDPQPAHEPAHHRDAHLLVVLVDLAASQYPANGRMMRVEIAIRLPT